MTTATSLRPRVSASPVIGGCFDGGAADAGGLRQCHQVPFALPRDANNVVEETPYVPDVGTAFAVAGKVRMETDGTLRPQLASNLIGATRLAHPEFLIEIAFKAVLS
ncbi:hypothetical protein [Hyphomicrobium sp.]|uniref:hypothetical protein n=1 Tax=Hyphomicrobium sp. TaxID=82 RepID=UPI002FDF6CBD